MVAIGNFDGVHMGHRDLFASARQLADKHDMDFTILTFSPHPRRVFQPEIAPFRLTPDPVKDRIIEYEIKPDHYTILDFNDRLRGQSAVDFIDHILIAQCQAGIIIVGKDFQFGNGRQGDIAMLQARSEFETIPYDLFEAGGDVISSTRIRDHLKQADIKQANALLGWDWFIEGEVVHGDKRGRELGYPTANMHFDETLVPAHGIYAVKVGIEGQGDIYFGAANIGIRPMFETRVPMVETYIFDFNDDLYGKNLRVYPVQKIRDEMKFDNLDALIDQMKKDCIYAKNILRNL